MTATVVHFAGSAAADEATVLSAGDVYVDVARFQAFVSGKPIALTYQEFELLRLLVGKADRIIPYEELVRALFRSKSVGMRRRLGVVVCRLRAKLEGSQLYRIQTVRGRGYGLTASMRESTHGD